MAGPSDVHVQSERGKRQIESGLTRPFDTDGAQAVQFDGGEDGARGVDSLSGGMKGAELILSWGD
jgi:hypothetical protein